MPIQGKGRLCGYVGCNASLEGRSANAKFCKPCAERRDAETRSKQAAERKSIKPLANAVGGKRHSCEEHKKKTVLCGTCGGMSWRRDSCTIAGRLCCHECRLGYEPEPPPTRSSVLGSSAGTAVNEGRLYGAQMIEGASHHGKK